MYRVYCLKDKQGNRVYVGYTGQELSARLSGHKRSYKDRKDLVIELIQEVETKDQAKALEVLYQRQYNTLHPNGLNIALGHKNNDGRNLIISGYNTRFGNRPKSEAEEQKRKSAAKEGVKKCQKPVRCINTGIVYPSITICAKSLGLSMGNLSMVLKGKRPHTKGLRFEFV